jgi:hypothetical protein
VAIVCRKCGHANADGAQFCARPDCGEYLGWQTQTFTGNAPTGTGRATGSATVSGSARVGGTGGQPAAYYTQRASAAATLASTGLVAAPGATATTTVTVHNGGSQVEEYRIAVVGPTAPWAIVEPATLHIYPGDRADATIRFAPPRHSSTTPGRWGYTVAVTSTLHQTLAASVDGTIDVGPFRAFQATLVPQQSTGRGRTMHRIDVANDGNVVERVRLQASDPTGNIRFAVPPAEVPIPPGGGSIGMAVQPPRKFFGQPRQFPFTIVASAAEQAAAGATGAGQTGVQVPPVRMDGLRVAVPLVPRWVPKVATAIVGLAVAALVALLVIPGSPLRKTSGSGGPSASPSISVPGSGSSGPQGSASASGSATPPPGFGGLGIVVDGSGHRIRGTDGSGVKHLGTGMFEVKFDRNVAGCSYVATVGDPSNGAVSQLATVSTAGGHQSHNDVYVETKDSGGNLTDFPFHLQVECPGDGDWAVVDAGGGTARGSNVASTARLAPGVYQVVFTDNQTNCAYLGTIGDTGSGVAPTPGLIFASSDGGNGVQVRTTDFVGTNTDFPFHLQTSCRTDTHWAVVRGDGSLVRGSGITGPARLATGQYEVTFDTDVTGCGYIATLGDPGVALSPDVGLVFTASGHRGANGVFVETKDFNGADADRSFMLQVEC